MAYRWNPPKAKRKRQAEAQADHQLVMNCVAPSTTYMRAFAIVCREFLSAFRTMGCAAPAGGAGPRQVGLERLRSKFRCQQASMRDRDPVSTLSAPTATERPTPESMFESIGANPDRENIVSHLFLSMAAAAAVMTAAPGSAAAPSASAPKLLAAAQAPGTARPAPQPQTRANLIKTAEANFQKVDTNNDRTLSKVEIDAAQARAQQQAAQNVQTRMSQEFTRLDTDRNGQLSLAEFRAAAPPVRPPAANASTVALQRLDANKDGKISIEEYRAPLVAGFDRIDTNKDGVLSADERAKAAAARTASRQ
jgi:Ca2+-binding EF-hand superfamily protein